MANKSIIEGIESKVARLIEQHDRLKKQAAELQAERDKLVAKNWELTNKLAEAERRITTLELSEGLAGNTADKKQAKARVNRLMREIDRCIALLNK